MFGYIKVHKAELKMKEYEIYRGIYCSLCKQIGKDYGIFSRLALNYDFTFLALCRMGMNEKSPSFTSSHCSFNCAKKCVCCEMGQEDLVYAAAVSEMMVYFKVRDNIHDGSLFEKIFCGAILPYVKSKYKKAKRKFPELAEYLEEQMDIQSRTEKEKAPLLDKCADPSGKSLAYVMSYGFQGENKKTAEYFGYSLGRLIYILDAAEDIEEDRRKNNFNPFIANEEKYGENFKGEAKRILDFTADEIARAFELLEIKRFKPIIKNIIYYGFEKEIEKVTLEKGCECEKSI